MPPFYTASTVPGAGRGGTIGFHTLNFAVPADFPYEHGVYAGRVRIDGQTHIAAVHYGPIPVFNSKTPSLEAHIIDVNLDHAPPEAEIALDIRLRDIRPFRDAESLAAQIKKDVERVQEFYATKRT